jgi:hypothetical protein
MRERRAGWRVLRIRSEYSLPLTFTKNRKRGRPSGPACCFVFGYQLGTGVPPWGPTPHPGPAVHSYGMTALHWAAYYCNRRIVGLLVASGADVNAQSRNGCAVSACGESAECAGRVAAAVCRAGTRRCTLPRPMAGPTPSRSCCCAAPTGPSRPTAGTAALRRTAEPKPQQPRACRDTPKQVAEEYGKLAEYEAAKRLVTARRLTPRHPPGLAPHSSARFLYRLMCFRRSPLLKGGRQPPTEHLHRNRHPRRGQGGNGPRSTRTVTGALAAPRRAPLHPRVEVYSTSRASCRCHRQRKMRSRTQY